MPTYDELKSELQNIANLLESFPEQIRPKVFDLLIEQYLGRKSESPPDLSELDAKDKTPQRKKSATRRTKKAGIDSLGGDVTPERPVRKKVSGKESYQIDRELNLRGNGSIPSFKSFCEEKAPASEEQFAAVSVYYLQKILGIEKINLNQVYTCYHEVGRRPPQAFRQAFINTKNRKGWVEFDTEGNLRVPHRGVVFVEHDLPSHKESGKDL